jgi:hypothetical protein
MSYQVDHQLKAMAKAAGLTTRDLGGILQEAPSTTSGRLNGFSPLSGSQRRILMEAIYKAQEKRNQSQTFTRPSKEEIMAIKAETEAELQNTVIAAAKANGIRAPEDEFILLKAKGFVGHKEDGTPFFNKLNEKGEKVTAASAEEMVKWLAHSDTHKRLPPATSAEARRAYMTDGLVRPTKPQPVIDSRQARRDYLKN